MKNTGIVRKIDNLGRVVIPMEVRRVNGWEEGTPMEFYMDNGKIILSQYVPGCTFCGEVGNTKIISEKHLCKKCIDEIIKAKGV